jgi:glycosyltransferase 2 family protein
MSGAETSSRRRALIRIAVAVFVVLAIAFFALALVKAWQDTDGSLPEVWRMLVTGATALIALLTFGYSWAILLGVDAKADHIAAFLVANLAKYIPGAVWQVSGQVGLAKTAGVSVKRGAGAFGVQAISQAVSGATFCVLLSLVWTDANIALRIVIGVGGIASLLLIDRRWMVWVLHKIPRTRDAKDEYIPAQRPILAAYVASLIAIGATSIGYLVMLGGFGHVDNPALVVAGYAAAWTVGFVVVPLPSGLGLREAVLVAILHGEFPAAILVAASVYQRLVVLATEGIVAAIASHRVRPSRLRAAAAAAATDTD